MKIQHVRVRHVFGTLQTEGLFWEERLVRPVDIYPDYRAVNWEEGGQQSDNAHLKIDQFFLEIITDSGIVGTAGPVNPDPARLIVSSLVPRLIGRDPLAGESLWDQMHRFQVHGRQGATMLAISAVDCALWDIRGQFYGAPVWRLLGGSGELPVPAYASMLGHNVEDKDLVRERAIAFKEKGYTAQKWFFRHGPMSGYEGLRKNVELVRTVREAVGEDYDLMFDCWQSFNLDYAVDLCSRIEEYRPRWIEECFMPDRIDTYAKLKAKTLIPLAGAEHEYTRWGFKRFLEKDALDILQPDIYWCGGLSEAIKIAAYATVHDLIVVPHGHSSNAGIHFSVSQSPIHTPYQEDLVKWNQITMHFLKTPVLPQDGVYHAPSEPGLGMALEADRIEYEEDLAA
ncbi:enolase C-terminal domain-like protein [uncultured Martelella sp.]|uniref:enolase C-terminal domain-like protein n=1 Tax=uncultured Martelella sp. TaxID=392331 RepID=UPI0029C729CF|nr:enolase C-terminal domain-like protein [uncultured Martelella sp.]